MAQFKIGGKFISDRILRKELTILKKQMNLLGYMKYLTILRNKQLKIFVMPIRGFSKG